MPKKCFKACLDKFQAKCRETFARNVEAIRKEMADGIFKQIAGWIYKVIPERIPK